MKAGVGSGKMAFLSEEWKAGKKNEPEEKEEKLISNEKTRFFEERRSRLCIKLIYAS